jgi:hypothetical protein
MTLQVPFEGFAKAAQTYASTKAVFLTSHPSGTVMTCVNPERSVHVVAVSKLPLDEARTALAAEGLEVLEGIWTEDGNVDLEQDTLAAAYVAAVSYHSNQNVPGVWVDCYPDQPNHVQVLRAMYEEFRETGEVEDVTFEEFIRLSNPNVVVVSATELRSYLDAKATETHPAPLP